MPEEGAYSLPTRWLGQDALPTLAANQFVLSDNAQWGETVMLVGHVAPPLLLGEEEEQRAQAEGLEFVPVQVLARFALSDIALKSLRDTLVEYCARIEDRRGQP